MRTHHDLHVSCLHYDVGLGAVNCDLCVARDGLCRSSPGKRRRLRTIRWWPALRRASGGWLVVEAVRREPVSKSDSLLTANLTGNFRPFAGYWGSERPSSLAISLPYVEKRQNQIRVFERQEQGSPISGTGTCVWLSRVSIRPGPSDLVVLIGVAKVRNTVAR